MPWRDARYIVMEYADGGDLAGKIKDGPVEGVASPEVFQEK